MKLNLKEMETSEQDIKLSEAAGMTSTAETERKINTLIREIRRLKAPLTKVDKFGLYHFDDCSALICDCDECQCCECGCDNLTEEISKALSESEVVDD